MSMNLPSHPKFVDAQSGIVGLELHPFFIERLHGEGSLPTTRLEAGLPFPLIEQAPTVVEVVGGMSRERVLEVAQAPRLSPLDILQSLTVAAYARPGFGWAEARFWFDQKNALSYLQLTSFSDDSEVKRREVLDHIEHDLGPPDSLVPLVALARLKRRLAIPAVQLIARWTLPWGEALFFRTGPEPGLAIGVRWLKV